MNPSTVRDLLHRCGGIRPAPRRRWELRLSSSERGEISRGLAAGLSLLRRTHADPRTTRRLLDEANDHLFAAADALEAAGMTRLDAEREAVRRFGSASELVRGSWRVSFGALAGEILRAAILLGGCGLVAVGLSGVVVAV